MYIHSYVLIYIYIYTYVHENYSNELNIDDFLHFNRNRLMGFCVNLSQQFKILLFCQ